MGLSYITFKNIDFEKDAELCIQFRADSYLISFGSTDAFFEKDGKGDQRYIAWLKDRIGATYAGFHIWHQDKIIGQIEMGRRLPEDQFGYINLYYLIPEMRGKGLSLEVEEFSMSYLKGLGFNRARLSVSPTNLRAINFYLKNGWKDLGQRNELGRSRVALDFPVNYMEKTF